MRFHSYIRQGWTPLEKFSGSAPGILTPKYAPRQIVAKIGSLIFCTLFLFSYFKIPVHIYRQPNKFFYPMIHIHGHINSSLIIIYSAKIIGLLRPSIIFEYNILHHIYID